MDVTTAFWGMTINNYDDTDLALVQQGYPDHVRQIVYTLERGEQGTPHIQAYLRLYRQQRLSYVKKLFPRGSFKALLADEYKLNAQRYAQKLDSTAESPAVITNNPFPDPVVELTSVTRSVWDHFMGDEDDPNTIKQSDFLLLCRNEEHQRVREKPALAKFYVSATYKSVKKEFWRSILQHVVAEDRVAQDIETHTHTHTQRKVIFSTGSITSDGEEGDSCEGGSGNYEGDDDSEGTEDEADSESERSECSEEDDC